jgi:hypothetical protein
MENTTKHNMMIAEFMEYPCVPIKDADGDVISYRYKRRIIFWREDELKFHKSWDWLMTVVEKINNISNEEEDFMYELIISPNECSVLDNNMYSDTYREEIVGNKHEATFIEVVYITVVEFIKWYNENKERDENR